MEALLRRTEVPKTPDRTSGGGSLSRRGDVVLSCDGSPGARVASGVAIEQAASFGVYGSSSCSESGPLVVGAARGSRSTAGHRSC